MAKYYGQKFWYNPCIYNLHTALLYIIIHIISFSDLLLLHWPHDVYWTCSNQSSYDLSWTYCWWEKTQWSPRRLPSHEIKKHTSNKQHTYLLLWTWIKKKKELEKAPLWSSYRMEEIQHCSTLYSPTILNQHHHHLNNGKFTSVSGL